MQKTIHGGRTSAPARVGPFGRDVEVVEADGAEDEVLPPALQQRLLEARGVVEIGLGVGRKGWRKCESRWQRRARRRQESASKPTNHPAATQRSGFFTPATHYTPRLAKRVRAYSLFAYLEVAALQGDVLGVAHVAGVDLVAVLLQRL